jgi:hypothetical protein
MRDAWQDASAYRETFATPEEVRAATAERRVTDGDTMWARGLSFREISDSHRPRDDCAGHRTRRAYVPTRMADCPACGEKVMPGVAVCRHCRAILDQEKATKHGLGLRAATTDDRRVRPYGGEKSKG